VKMLYPLTYLVRFVVGQHSMEYRRFIAEKLRTAQGMLSWGTLMFVMAVLLEVSLTPIIFPIWGPDNAAERYSRGRYWYQDAGRDLSDRKLYVSQQTYQ
jgi:hypothetical protein